MAMCKVHLWKPVLSLQNPPLLMQGKRIQHQIVQGLKCSLKSALRPLWHAVSGTQGIRKGKQAVVNHFTFKAEQPQPYMWVGFHTDIDTDCVAHVGVDLPLSYFNLGKRQYARMQLKR